MEGIARAEAMFELTRDWVRQRKAFGKRVADLQTVLLKPLETVDCRNAQVQHKLAELKTALSVCRAFVDSCLSLHNNSKLDSEMASMAKYWATDLENRVAGECLQLHGGGILHYANSILNKKSRLGFHVGNSNCQVLRQCKSYNHLRRHQ